jgi:hypothetical protein
MQHAVLESFASQFQIPLPVARQLAGVIAQRCALVANRYEPEGSFTVDQRTAVEAVGAGIGAAILETFPLDGEAEPPSTQLELHV